MLQVEQEDEVLAVEREQELDAVRCADPRHRRQARPAPVQPTDTHTDKQTVETCGNKKVQINYAK